MSATRLPSGGRIDRSRPLRFTFDGAAHTGFAGDTLGSALLANGVDVVARGVYSGRPRGILAAGVEEPGALVQVETATASEPMLRAPAVELVDGLAAYGLQGKGRLVPEAGGRFDKRWVHCDVLVIGGGPAGLAAAMAAGRTGARVILAEQDTELGGALLSRPADRADGAPAIALVAHAREMLAAWPDARVLTRATVTGLYDHGSAVIAQRVADGVTEGRLWHVRARRIVLATGAIERPIVFRDNDRPGIMLAGAARTYLHRYGVRAGERAVVFTTNDDGLAAVADLAAAGTEVVRIADARQGARVTGTEADDAGRLCAVLVDGERIPADLLLVSGGWNPTVHLWSHTRGSIRWEPAIAAFVPDQPNGPMEAVGAAAGRFALADCLADGLAAGARAAHLAGFGDGAPPPAPQVESAPVGELGTRWVVDPEPGDDGSHHLVDLEREAPLSEVLRAVDAGLRSIEHVKRYTTIGTASDQGKTSGVVSSAIAAALLGQDAGVVGVTTFRPPYTPVSFQALAGRERGELFEPVRVTAIHDRHVALGAVFELVGQWHRARHYPLGDEDMEAAVGRECRAARASVGIFDASTLGKIDIQGPDAALLLDRLYTNTFSTLAVGACRYGLMCGLDGMVMDDGVTSRLADDRFHMTTTTGGAAHVMDHIEEWLQTEWPDLRVRATSVTEQWAVVGLAGPRSRDVLAALAPDLDASATAFPFMTWRDATVAGIPARVFRISFSGELAYEINVAWWHGRALWDAAMTAGAPFGITPYGTEAMHVLRAEKGYPIIGQETDGSVTPDDLGMGRMVSTKKPFIGDRSLKRSDTVRPGRKQLVGLLPVDPTDLPPEGAQLVADPDLAPPMPMLGHITSAYRSDALGRTFALALVKDGRARIGTTVYAPLPDRTVAAVVTSPVLFDPENLRRDG
ncbi:MAG: 2Fe-2S iron-sulfur cluster-binding protein [Chloroflexota bacterium]